MQEPAKDWAAIAESRLPGNAGFEESRLREAELRTSESTGWSINRCAGERAGRLVVV